MAKKKKNKKTKNRHKNIQLHNQAPETLIENARSALASGKARDAVECLKIALKKQEAPEAIYPLLFRAYLARGKELREKSMDVEADMVAEQAQACKPAMDQISETDLADYAGLCPLDQAIDAYAEYMTAHPPAVKVERQLVNRLIQSENWDLLDRLPLTAPIRKDASALPEAVSKMNTGDWEAALDDLRSIPRASPYAPLRMLCRAMCAFYREDDRELQKIIPMLPDDFLLSPVMRQLGQFLQDPAKTSANTAMALFFDSPPGDGDEITELIKNIHKKQKKDAINMIKQLAQRIYPENPEACIETILEIMSSSVTVSGRSQNFYLELAATLLPRKKATALILRLDMMSGLPLDSAAKYIDLIPQLYPDPRQQATAKSLVMLRAFKLSLEKDTLAYELEEDLGFYDFEAESTNWAALGISSDDPDTAYLEIAREGIACDPENREWYELMLKLPHRHKEQKQIVENALQEMAAHFPDDPFPHLEMAGLYQQKSAYRKAEKALEEAARRAPYDNRVIEKKAIGYLISAKINLKRGKYHLVGTDLEKAESLGCRPAVPFIRAKQAALALIRSQAEPEASPMFSDLAGLARIQGLSVLFLELSGSPRQKIADAYDETLRQGINAEIKRELASISEIQSAEMRRLLYPVPLAYMPAMPAHPLHTTPAVLPVEEIFRLLPGVQEADIIVVCDLLLDMGWYDTVYKELSRRLSETSAAGRPLMDFYCTVLADLSGETTDTEHLMAIVDDADAETDRKLKQAAFNLAPHARGELQLALRYYDLELLMFRNEWVDEDEWDDEFDDEAIDDGDWLDDDFDEEDDAYYEGMTPAQIIEDLEAIVDRMKFRNSSPTILRIMRPIVFNSRPETKFVKDILESFPPDILESLSPEARVLFLEDPVKKR